MTASIHEIDAATRGVAIRKSEYSRLFGISQSAVGAQVRQRKLETARIGGVDLILTAPIREALGLPVAA